MGLQEPNVPFFTLIDIPGLIQSTRDEQDESDVDHIEEATRSFISNERSIVLVVISEQPPYLNVADIKTFDTNPNKTYRV